MLSVLYAEYHKKALYAECLVLLSITCKPFMLNAIMLNVVMLGVMSPSLAPLTNQELKKDNVSIFTIKNKKKKK